ncbi:hypothetical protein Btru_033461 [Bulinus truncatus]|nr:hypothetical protein Btru_033461 [Bulinus truncatus]
MIKGDYLGFQGPPLSAADVFDIGVAAFKESVDDVIKQCLNICQSLEDRVCLNDCFEITFTQLKHDVLYSGNNATTNNGSQTEPSTTTTQAQLLDILSQNDHTSAPYVDVSTAQLDQTPLSRLGLTKTLRSDKSNSIMVVHNDVMYDVEPLAKGTSIILSALTPITATPQPSDGPYGRETEGSTKDEAGAAPAQLTKMDSDTPSGSPHSRWKFSKEELLTFIQNYGYLMSPYLRMNYSMNPNSSMKSTQAVDVSTDFQGQPTDTERIVKNVKDLLNPNMGPLGKIRHFENQSRIERLLQANRKFLQREGVDMISVDKTLYNLLDILVVASQKQIRKSLAGPVKQVWVWGG